MGQGEAGARPAASLELSLEEAIQLALTKSRSAISARLGREEQALTLEAAEERYDPMVSVSVGANAEHRGDETAKTADVSIGPSLRVPTGGSFRLSWRKPLAGEGDREASTELSFQQPLLKGFGTDIDTQPLRRARLQARVDLRAFRDTAAGIVESAISAYRGVLRTARRLVIAREALERAQRQLEINRTLVEAGRMAPQDLVQTQADVANKEYALADAENGLETANSVLVNTLDLEEGVRIEPREEPPIVAERPDLEKSLETAFARRTDWLRAEIGMELARMGLLNAESNLLPDLSLSARATQRGGQDRTEWSGGLNLTVQLQDDGPRREFMRALPDNPNYCFVPAYEIEDEVQQIRIVIEGMSGYVPTALVALSVTDAEEICNKLNRRLGLDYEAWTALAAKSMRAEEDDSDGDAWH